MKTTILAVAVLAVASLSACTSTSELTGTVTSGTVISQADVSKTIDSCQSIAIQYLPNGNPSEVGDVDQLYNMPVSEARARAKAVASRNPSTRVLVDNGSCQLVIAYKE